MILNQISENSVKQQKKVYECIYFTLVEMVTIWSDQSNFTRPIIRITMYN